MVVLSYLSLTFSPSAKVLTAAGKSRRTPYFIKRSFTCPTVILPYRVLVRPHLEYAIQANFPYLEKDIYHMERIQGAVTRWVNCFRVLTYEERFKALKLQSLEKRIRKNLILINKLLYSQINLEATQLSKFPRRPGLRRSSLRILQQTGRTRRRRIRFAYRGVKY